MAVYIFANRTGELVKEDYDNIAALNKDQILQILKETLEYYPESFQIDNEKYSDVYKVEYGEKSQFKNIYACVKGLTPGGRKDTLNDEQRIQAKAKFLNEVFQKKQEGLNGLVLAIYQYDGVTIYCAWKAAKSTAGDDSPISKQIKIDVIADAIKEGFAQRKLRNSDLFVCAFRPEFFYFYLLNSDWIHDIELKTLNGKNYGGDEPLEDTGDNEEQLVYETSLEIEKPWNRIFFGAPGTGKSFKLEEERKKLLGETQNYERVTFHPSYSYANFVGTYKPVPAMDKDGKDTITYEYVPGPFMRLLVKALRNARTEEVEPFVLVIEEINRAQVAAVFGEVFQLLDRDDNGVSVYAIQTSEDIKKHLAKELGGNLNHYSEIRIPNNMFIWATMNSADQGVNPVDTAFKRRWEFEYIGINNNEELIDSYTMTCGEGTHQQKVKWNDLRKAINKELSSTYKINEDKLLGPFFLSMKILKNGDNKALTDAFKSKVLMYLFEDAAKSKRPTLFQGCGDKYNIYSEVCNLFDKMGIEIFNSDICSKFKNL